MEKAQKQEHIDFLKGVFGDVESVVLSSVSGLNVGQVTDLRKMLHKSDVGFRVIKNKLAKIAAKDTPLEILSDDFAGPTAMAWSVSDAVAPAKILVKFQKDVEEFLIKSGFNAGKRLDLNEVKSLAKMPSLDELRAQFLGLLEAVPGKLLAQVNAPAQHVVGVLQAKVDKGEEAAA